MRAFLFILILTLFAIKSAFAVVDSTRFVHFNVANGMPSNNVYSLLKDKKGYMWFCTERGVVKYNGYSFKKFDASNGLPTDDIWQLYLDQLDRVWVYGFGYGFGHIKNDKYHALPFKTNDRLFVANLLSEQDGIFYFITGHDVEYLMVVAGDIVRYFPVNTRDGRSLINGNLLKLEPGYSIVTIDSGVNIYKQQWKNGRWESEKICSLPHSDVRQRTRTNFSPDSRICVFSFNGKWILIRDLDNCSEKTVKLKDIGADEEEKIYAVNPYYAQGNYDGRSVIITGKGVYYLDSNFNFLYRQRLSDLFPGPSQLAYRMRDDLGNLWLTTNSDGVWLDPRIPSIFSRKQGVLPVNSVLIGTVGNRSYWADRRQSVLYELEQEVLVNKLILPKGIGMNSITGDSRYLYIGSVDGTMYYDKVTGTISRLDEHFPVRLEMNSALKRSNMYRAEEDNPSLPEMFLNQSNKVVLHDGQLFTLAHDFALSHHLRGDSIISTPLLFDRFENICANPATGDVIFYNTKKMILRNSGTKTDRVLAIDKLKESGINNIKQLASDRYGNVFLLGDDNIYLLDLPARKVSRLNFGLNLHHAEMRIAGDKLVLAGDFGVGYSSILGPGRVSPVLLAPNYTAGKPSYDQVEYFSVTEDGSSVLKTDRGVFSFSMRQLQDAATLSLAKGDFFTLLISEPEARKVSQNDTVRVRQEERKISFDAINYHGKGEVIFSYDISSDGKVVESSTGDLFLEALEPGAYHTITCRINDDLYQSPAYTFYIYRYPYWWQTPTWRTVFWMTGVGLFITLILVVILVTRYVTARKNARKRMLTDLELRAIHSQINPHFIFNTLSAALFFINKKRFDDAYVHVNKFSQLLRSYLKSSQDRYTTLDEEIKMLRNYIELQQIRFEAKFEYEIEVDNKLPLGNIRIPSLLLQPLVENAINHGLFHRAEGGWLQLKFMQGADSSELVCIIEDNGVGRIAAKKINEAATASKESYGTKLTNQLLEVFKLYEKLDIKLEYIDKTPPETGTIVTLILKNIKYVA